MSAGTEPTERGTLLGAAKDRAANVVARLTRWVYEPFPPPDADGRDPFRWCIYCGSDCEEGETDHAPDCPSNTGLYPVSAQDLGMRGPRDPYAHGLCCAECGSELRVGDYRTHQRTERDDVFVTVCVGCQILHPETTLE